MLARDGIIRRGHPFVEITVSADGKTGSKYTALIDTGYSGFVSIPLMAATLLGLKAQTTVCYELANGKQSEPIPHALGYACVEGDPFVQGLIAFSGNTSAIVGVDFLTRCGHILLMSSKGITLLNEKEMEEVLREAAKEAADDARKAIESKPA
jgi:predicted aspartyl protease